MSESKNRYFIALLPPDDVQAEVRQIQQYFAHHYASCHAQKSPPHITLQPPFQWSVENLPSLLQLLNQFAIEHKPIPIILHGFGAFSPRVIYVNVVKTQELLDLQADLIAACASLGVVDRVATRAFTPHMTVAFRDLSRQNFKLAWSEFQQQQLHFEFTATKLTLLIHDRSQWQIESKFQFHT